MSDTKYRKQAEKTMLAASNNIYYNEITIGPATKKDLQNTYFLHIDSFPHNCSVPAVPTLGGKKERFPIRPKFTRVIRLRRTCIKKLSSDIVAQQVTRWPY